MKNSEIHRMNMICNIQMVYEKIDPEYKVAKTFRRLGKLTDLELEAEQESAIKLWNEYINFKIGIV